MEDISARSIAEPSADLSPYRPEGVGSLDRGTPFREAALRAIVADPRFRAVAEASAAEATAQFQRLDGASRWLLKDLGRTSIYVATFALHAFLGSVTQSGLVATLVAQGVASRARVVAFVDRAIATGRLRVAPGSLPWTQRPLIPNAGFVDVLFDRLAGAFRVMGQIDTGIAAAADRMSNERIMAAAYVAIGRISATAEALGAPALPRMQLFMQRDGGLKLLQALLIRQAPDRDRLLESVSFSKTDVARDCGVSRIHLDTLLRDAEAAGLLTRVGRNGIIFDRALNDSYELWVALQIQGARLVAETILAFET
jgi:hypothetical protein